MKTGIKQLKLVERLSISLPKDMAAWLTAEAARMDVPNRSRLICEIIHREMTAEQAGQLASQDPPSHCPARPCRQSSKAPRRVG